MKNTGKSVEIWPGMTVRAMRAKDGAIVIEIDGSPDDDHDCERVRVYLNDGFAAEWVGVGDPRYGKQ